ncbi:filamentous hemagglutinin N-terminal domain-containing protein [Muribacter muris]|uniref:Filamentous hemagglutinin N-terminal domain-containing protein n=2 Tax=Muribacter muris TaxID=67855 RepID=A0A4Y9JQR1_9PAST|nr:filamentous hemagglutinin N-terminal domain-containing protein [Muribacter muris]
MRHAKWCVSAVKTAVKPTACRMVVSSNVCRFGYSPFSFWKFLSMQKMSLSKITVALSLCYATQFSYAEIQAANGQTQVARQQGVEIINIATPSQSGLSHNQYNKFNVDKAGAVLNNARQNSQTQLAGQVAANPNLRSQAATVILNEVVSRNPSHIAGKQEIAGQRADYVLANPNGISVDGGGFINTPRASLVVGKATVESGKLTGYQVDGEQGLTTKGSMSGATNVDLIAPTVNVSSNIQAKDGNVNILQGRNKIERADNGELTVSVLPQQEKILDGKVAGSIQAGRIRIHSTDDRASLEVTGSNLTAKQVTVTGGNVKLNGKVTDNTVSSSKNINDKDKFVGKGKSQKDTQQFTKTSVKADSAIVVAANQLVLEGADIQAKDAILVGGKTHLGSVKTKGRTVSTEERSKGSAKIWENSFGTTEKVHHTNIVSDNLKLIATEGKLTGDASKINAQNLVLHGEQGITFQGATEQNFYSDSSVFKNISSKRKTGKSLQSAAAQNYVASELNVKGDLIISSGSDIQFAGTIGRVDGDLVIANGGKLQFKAEEVKNSHNVDDKEKYWGGLAGSKTLVSTRNDREQHGADFTVKGAILADAKKGVNISGSRVISGKDALVKANEGSLRLDSVENFSSYQEQGRKGTIFDITKERTKGYKVVYTQQGSDLRSQSNLRLVSDKNVDIIGSRVQAGGVLDIVAGGDINIQGSRNHLSQNHTQSGIGFTAKVEKPTLSLDKEGVAKSSVDLLVNVIEDKVKRDELAKNLVSNVKDNLKFKGEASATLGFYKHNKSLTESTHTASSVSGGETNLAANNVNVAGSKVSATNSDLNINANNVNTQAQHNSSDSTKKNTDVGITNTVTVTESGITNKLSFGVQHSQANSSTTSAQGSQLSAANNLNINANQGISHSGSQLNAGQNISENAQNVSHKAESNTESNHKKNVDVGLTLTTSLDKNKVVNGSLVLGASGGREQSSATNAQSTTVTAGNDVNVNAAHLTDVGTQYQGGGNVNLNSQSHNIQSAQNTKQNDKLNAGVTIGVSASTKDFASANVGVNAGIHFQKDQSNSTTAHKANVQGENVNITTGTLNSQGDISATHNVNIKADQANFTQSQNTSSHKGGGFTLNVGVGAIVVPAAGAAVPSVDVNFTANGHKGSRTDAVSHNVQGGNNVGIHGKDSVNLQGTNVTAGNNASITGNTVDVQPGKSNVNDLNVSVGGGVSVGANTSSLGINGNINVQHENSTTHQGVSINGQNVNIQAQNGVNLTGVSSNSTNLNLDGSKGDVNLNAAKNNVNKTGVDVGLSLNGGISDDKWVPASGSGKLNVDVIRNETHTTTDLNTQNATISGNNAQFNGGSVNAPNVTNNLSGKTTTTSVTDKVSETSVNLSANGSGKFTPYPADKWAESAKKDWDNGTIAGVKSDVNVKVDSTKTETVKQGGINPAKPQVVKNKVVKTNIVLTTKKKEQLLNMMRFKHFGRH